MLAALLLTSCGATAAAMSGTDISPDESLVIATGSQNVCGKTFNFVSNDELVNSQMVVKNVTISFGADEKTIGPNQTTTVADILFAFLDGRLKVFCP